MSTPAPAARDWRDAALTPGDWTYASDGGGAIARYGPGAGSALLSLRCDRAQGAVSLERAGSAPGAVPLTVTTSEGGRAFSATPMPGSQPTLAVRFAARDSFLDMLAFSRGRFAVEAAGLPALFVPAWPEVARVIEDCR
jgi:hypothetical protein